ncbi:prolipoprotein diacylglyceryl transferase [Spiroplasma poulsonii]|uniref:Prolipoprotein diacylglyceryl transferase n=1 Tax=Spiroplasma poulsonii TaxID=2138 RepID=A0A2P6FF76_9MOLU|nr:prolipoprotein diacylglyceryl transferase [Spiroplasma poulsonii]KAF0850224.1 Prolipoprotein diacylglyceryl transferase [Spiroplasma poulsonii]PQM32109.1 Prolipoprotein diacylglyceryl transferase [Spiroplasma poulsonii]PWF94753.1 Prolipoprotein diacylglyceryl transferase [Spiroplasma poulsonii]PWF97551.1 Prolipoprotein diacylglyceryl transferase [Spiroplasma poulsonii]
MSNILLTSGPPSPNWITPTNTPYDILATYGGWVHMYAVFITTGMILSVLVCFIRLKIKKIPIEPLIWSIFVIIPFSLFGASFFGKVNNDIHNLWVTEPGAVPFWSLFAFWKAGMSIHGGVLFGTIAGLIVFGIVGRKAKVSLWVYTDAIIPNILLGQVLGRWGNFFNHELLGSVASYDSLRWLPAFIRDNLWQWDGLSPETVGGQIVFRQPIFLYESFFNFLAWLFITFFIPFAGQLFSKKPWKKDSKEYPFDLKYNFIHFFNRKYIKKDKMTWKEVWDKAYFNYVPTQKQLDEMPKVSITKSKSELGNTFKRWWHNDSAQLTKLNNPGRYSITRSGVQTGFYFFLWNLIRFVLETQRDDVSTLFIKNYRKLDYAVLILIAVLGLVLAVYAQLGAPRKFRKNGFIYEKEYVDFESLQTWKFDKYLTNNIVIGEDNYVDKLPTIIKIKVMEFLGYQDETFDKYFELKYFKANDQTLTNNEITNYSFKIVALPTKNNKFIDDLVVNQTYKVDLSKVLKHATLKLTKPNNNQYLTLSNQQFGTLLNDLAHHNETATQIKVIWNKFYPNINEKKTTIFNLNLNELINFDELKISPDAKKIEVSKFKFKENQFYYFNKKVCFKLNWQ